jgi:hypothetical protein
MTFYESIKNMLIPYFTLNDSGRLKDLVEACGMIAVDIVWQAAERCSSDDRAKLRPRLDHIVNNPPPPPST